MVSMLRILLFLGVVGFVCEAAQAQEAPETPAPTGIFSSYELKGSNLSAFPQWLRVQREIKHQQGLYNRCQKGPAYCPEPALSSWQAFIGQLREQNLSQADMLSAVQKFSRRWPYREDADVYNQTDFWASPKHFLAKGGDCEDFAILNYVTLRDMGIPPEHMRIVIVRDTIRQMHHAVLAVYPENESEPVVVLDSLMNDILTASEFSHYTPFYSLNHEHRWIHIPQKELY